MEPAIRYCQYQLSRRGGAPADASALLDMDLGAAGVGDQLQSKLASLAAEAQAQRAAATSSSECLRLRSGASLLRPRWRGCMADAACPLWSALLFTTLECPFCLLQCPGAARSTQCATSACASPCTPPRSVCRVYTCWCGYIALLPLPRLALHAPQISQHQEPSLPRPRQIAALLLYC